MMRSLLQDCIDLVKAFDCIDHAYIELRCYSYSDLVVSIDFI